MHRGRPGEHLRPHISIDRVGTELFARMLRQTIGERGERQFEAQKILLARAEAWMKAQEEAMRAQLPPAPRGAQP